MSGEASLRTRLGADAVSESQVRAPASSCARVQAGWPMPRARQTSRRSLSVRVGTAFAPPSSSSLVSAASTSPKCPRIPNLRKKPGSLRHRAMHLSLPIKQRDKKCPSSFLDGAHLPYRTEHGAALLQSAWEWNYRVWKMGPGISLPGESRAEGDCRALNRSLQSSMGV